MTNVTSDPAYPGGPSAVPSRFESVVSGVSWGAIIAGAVGAAAMAMILTVLGAGLGLIAVSPWQGHGASAGAVGAGVIIWSLIVHAVAFGLGGYLAGRLRTKWANIHGDEVYFRDTAHGFVTWALGSLVSLAIMSSVAGHLARSSAEISAMAGGAALAGAGAAGGMAMHAGGPMGGPDHAMRGPGNPMDYYIDQLFRPAGPAPAGQNGAATGTTTDTTGAAMTGTMPMGTPPANGNPGDLGPMRAEIGRIVAASFKNGEIAVSPADKAYVASLIAQRTGLSQQDAEKRIDTVVEQAKAAVSDAEAKAKQAADDARKAGAALALWTFVALILGAFCASFMATLGGRHRDR